MGIVSKPDETRPISTHIEYRFIGILPDRLVWYLRIELTRIYIIKEILMVMTSYFCHKKTEENI